MSIDYIESHTAERQCIAKKKILKQISNHAICDQSLKDQEFQKFLDTTKMTLCESLGKGGFGDVFLATAAQKQYAVKRMFVSPTDPQREKKNHLSKEEMVITCNLRNKNCIRSLGSFDFQNSKFLILERAVNKDLSFIIHTFYSKKLFTLLQMNNEISCKLKWYSFMSESLVSYFFVQLVNALDYLRQMNFVHRDIKPENLLVTSTFQLKLADFYLATEVKKKEKFKLSTSGSSAYMAPEIFSEKKEVLPNDVFKIDYYSAGVVIIKMLLNEYLWSKDNKIDYSELLNKIKDAQTGKFYALREATTDEVKNLIKHLIEPEVSKRAGITEIKKHEWVNMNRERVQFLHDVNTNDPLKFLLEGQKCDFIPSLCKRNQISKGNAAQSLGKQINEYKYIPDKKKTNIYFNKRNTRKS